ncbi:corticotropin-releasing factor receptor 2, partial [Biomphalaria pfeifferi]
MGQIKSHLQLPKNEEEELEAGVLDIHELYRKTFDACIAKWKDVTFYKEPDVLYCNSTSDTFTCWPATRAGGVAQERCPEHSVVDQTANVTKLCRDNGTWETANYSACMPNTTHSTETHK